MGFTIAQSPSQSITVWFFQAWHWLCTLLTKPTGNEYCPIINPVSEVLRLLLNRFPLNSVCPHHIYNTSQNTFPPVVCFLPLSILNEANWMQQIQDLLKFSILWAVIECVTSVSYTMRVFFYCGYGYWYMTAILVKVQHPNLTLISAGYLRNHSHFAHWGKKILGGNCINVYIYAMPIGLPCSFRHKWICLNYVEEFKNTNVNRLFH